MEKRTELLLRRLQQVFHDGYRPARGTQSYNVKLKNKTKAYAMVNCYGHACFNLQNEQLNDYNFETMPLFGNFSGMFYDTQSQATARMLDFIRATGLRVEECDPDKPIEEFKSWKVGIYFEKHEYKRDFHLLLEEQPHLWSSKIGFEPCLEHIYCKKPPYTYFNMVVDDPVVYEFHGAYKITNPNADANNRYLKNFNFSTKGLKELPKYRHCVIEDARENTYEKMLEDLCAARGLI